MIIFMMPLGAVLISTGVAFLIFKSLSYFVIGLSTVIAGITIDYGIYVYLAVRKAGNNTTYDPAIASKATAIINSLLHKKIITRERKIKKIWQ